jgi:hypothetical protein
LITLVRSRAARAAHTLGAALAVGVLALAAPASAAASFDWTVWAYRCSSPVAWPPARPAARVDYAARARRDHRAAAARGRWVVRRAGGVARRGRTTGAPGVTNGLFTDT